MTTKTEKLIRHSKRRTGVLVPLLEDLFLRPVEIESDEDVQWIADLLQRMVERQNNRNSRPLFSPSQLSACLRYVYLLKHHKELGIERAKVVRVEPHFYFFNGNFLHLKWQFALYKLDKELPDDVFALVGVEVPIVSKRGDHGGTADAIVLIHGELYVVDFKGLNVRTFGEITRGYVPAQYMLQLGDYGMLYNAQRKNNGWIKKGLLISESKGGPDAKHLIALHETEVEIETQLPEVRRRLEVLRNHGEENSIPEIECQSTGEVQFLGCPFRKFCKAEVQARQRERRDAARKDSTELEVARPTRRKRGKNSAIQRG